MSPAGFCSGALGFTGLALEEGGLARLGEDPLVEDPPLLEDDPPPQPATARPATNTTVATASPLRVVMEDLRRRRNPFDAHRRSGGSARRPRQVNARSNLTGKL